MPGTDDVADERPAEGTLDPLSEAALRTLISAAAVGFAVLDRDLRYLACNEQLARVNGLSVQDHLGRSLHEVVPHLAEGAAAMLRHVLTTGLPIREFELSGTVADSGDVVRHWLESAYPVFGDDGRPVAVAVMVWEVTARVEAEQARGRMLALLELLVLRAPIGIAFVDQDLRFLRINQTLAEANGLPIADHLGRTVAEVLPEVAPDVVPLLRKVLTTGAPLVDLDVETGPVPGQPGRRRHWRVSYYPIRDLDEGPAQGVGLIVVDQTDRHEGRLEREQLRAAERAARLRAEQAASRQALLQRLTAALAPAVTATDVAQVTISTIGPSLSADAVTLVRHDAEAGMMRVLAQQGLSPQTAQRFAAYRVEDSPVIALVAGSGEPVVITSRADRDQQFPHLAHLPLEHQAWVNLPLIAEGRLVGVVAFGWRQPREFDTDKLELLKALAAQCAVALDRARLYADQQRLYAEQRRLYAEQAHVARRLQDSLLPDALPEVAHLESTARYFSADAGIDVGGDFYDLFALDDRRWAAVIGDVAGRGVEAAGTTALARHTLRALGPYATAAASLQRLNTLLCTPTPAARLLTAAYAHLTPDTAGGWTLTLARAGHPAPLLLHPDGHHEFLQPRGVLLGATADPPLTEVTYPLRPGDTLVFYTDGVTEAQGDDGLFGEERLAEAATTAAGQPADAVAEAILAAVSAYNIYSVSDDRALLVLHVPGSSTGT
ncbi:SpoIIE family protein phosphatase [Micromonospora mangrovi]|uniref:SpoIIE family protein phosphatase n=2 Tax=Micromonospora TaxID=1873 RepID=A0AAU8HJC6_9ACTN